MKRRLDCAFCGRALPAGCRIDKRYCDQRCVELAYYDRHPDKRAQKLAKLRGTRAITGLRARRAESAPELVERMEAAHASTRQELGAVRERLAQMEALLRSQNRTSKEQGQPQRAVQDAASLRKVTELQAELQAARNRAEQAERRQARLEQRIEELNQQLRERDSGEDTSAREVAIAREAARKAEQRSRDLEAALKPAQAGVARPVSVVQDPAQSAALQAAHESIADFEAKLQAAAERASQAERAKGAAESQVGELRRAVESWRAHAGTQTSKLTEAQSALRAAEQRACNEQRHSNEASSARLPWTEPAPDDAHRYIPRWEDLATDALQQIDQLADAALAEVPSQLWKSGNRKLSQEMRDWLAEPSRFLLLISRQMVLRIICTPPPERRSEKQKEVLAEAALADTIQFLRRRCSDSPGELEQAITKDQENYGLLAEELVLACVEHRLTKYR